jgi:hypothetical protein
MALKVGVNKVKAVTCTQQYRIEGEVYVPVDSRFTDYMNAEMRYGFIPITNGRVYSMTEGKLLYETPFLNVNKNFIIMAIPEEGV